MRKLARKRLALTTEIVKQLSTAQLAQVGGGEDVLLRSRFHCFNTDACNTAINTCSC